MAGSQSNCALAGTSYSPPEQRTKLTYLTEINGSQCNCAEGLFSQKHLLQPCPGFACLRGRPPPGHRSHPRLLAPGDRLSFLSLDQREQRCPVHPETLSFPTESDHRTCQAGPGLQTHSRRGAQGIKRVFPKLPALPNVCLFSDFSAHFPNVRFHSNGHFFSFDTSPGV